MSFSERAGMTQPFVFARVAALVLLNMPRNRALSGCIARPRPVITIIAAGVLTDQFDSLPNGFVLPMVAEKGSHMLPHKRKHHVIDKSHGGDRAFDIEEHHATLDFDQWITWSLSLEFREIEAPAETIS